MQNRKRKSVDPKKSEQSTAADAIPTQTASHRGLVDPKSGEPSTAANAIPYQTFYHRRPVDPKSGGPSTEADAITYGAFLMRKRRLLKKNSSSMPMTPRSEEGVAVLAHLNCQVSAIGFYAKPTPTPASSSSSSQIDPPLKRWRPWEL